MSYKLVTIQPLTHEEADALVEMTAMYDDQGDTPEDAPSRTVLTKLAQAIANARLTTLGGFTEGDRVTHVAGDTGKRRPGRLVNVFPNRGCIVRLDKGYSVSADLDHITH